MTRMDLLAEVLRELILPAAAIGAGLVLLVVARRIVVSLFGLIDEETRAWRAGRRRGPKLPPLIATVGSGPAFRLDGFNRAATNGRVGRGPG